MTYIDGCVIPVAGDKRDAYIAYAQVMAKVLVAHGALRVVETWGENVPVGKVTDFFRSVACQDGETVVYSWIEWPSKQARDAGWEAAMQDPAMPSAADQVFDGKRMIFGGFDIVVDTRA